MPAQNPVAQQPRTPEQLLMPGQLLSEDTLATNPDFKNGVMAVDPTTIAIAFRKLSDHVHIPLVELKPTEDGRKLFEGLAHYTESDFDVHDVVADAGGEDRRNIMNELAQEHGFGQPFENPFRSNQIGVLSIVDKKMKWHEGDADKATVCIRSGEEHQYVEGVKFKLKSINDDNFAVFDVKGFTKPVVRIAADPEQSGGVQNFMWVTEISPDENPSPIDLFEGVKRTVDVISQNGAIIKQRGASEVASVTMPKLTEVKYERDWEEIVGTTLGANDDWEVDQAKQAVRVSIDEIGAEAAAMFSMSLSFRGAAPVDPREHIVIGDSGPMLVWFTEGDSRLPICATITNQEAWQKTER